VIFSFNCDTDGESPYAGLIALNRILYGTTYRGGTSDYGTVFKVSTSGEERVLYNFKGDTDGAYPYANLSSLKGALYGTTYGGGASGGWGTVFRVSTSGDERVLYSFQAGTDGAHPFAGLVALNGTLYVTTYRGAQAVGGRCSR
jgi:uncharacterized repeat protein (TIGR03803 family)